MKRILLCVTVIALVGACGKKKEDTTSPDGVAGGGGGGKPTETTKAQEPDPPQIADARKSFLAGQYNQVVESLRPLVDDLKTRQQTRASGLAAGWLALALAEDVVENSKDPADHSLAMADQTGDAEVKVVARLAQGTFKLKTQDFAGAANDFEEAYNTQKDGPNAGLALVMYGNTKINLAFGGEEGDTITKPEELDSANTSFVKAQRLVEKQPGNEMIAARALEGQAAVANYKKNTGEACRLIGEATAVYTAKNAGQALIDAANALKDAANCPGSAPAK
jgi:hypothetical protein